MYLSIKSTRFIRSYTSMYGTPSFLAAPSTQEAAKASLISSRGNCILSSISILFCYAKKVPMSAMKACFQIAECSLSYAKRRIFLVSSKINCGLFCFGKKISAYYQISSLYFSFFIQKKDSFKLLDRKDK